MTLTDQIAQEIADAVNAAELGEFTAQRTHLPSMEEAQGELGVFVWPFSRKSEPVSRDARQIEVRVEIGFLQRIEEVATQAATIDPLHTLVEQIDDLLYRDARLLPSGAMWQGSELRVLHDHAELREQAIFCSVLAVTYVGHQ